MINRTPSGRFRVRVKHKGNVVADRTFDLKREAVAFETEQKRRLLLGEWVEPKLGDEPVRSFADRWLSARAGLVATKTLKTEEYLLRRMSLSLARRPIGTVQASDIEGELGRLIGGGAAYSSVRRFRSVISAMFGSAVRERIIVKSPVLGVRVPRGTASQDRREIYPFAIEELRQVYRDQCEINERAAALTLFLGLTGLRFGEAAALRVRDIQTVPIKAIRVSRSAPTGEPIRNISKGGKDRTVPLVDEVWPLVEDRMRGKSADDLIWTNSRGGRLNGWAWKCVVQWAETARGRRVHDLRHSFATWALSSGIPPKTVQAWLGHSSMTLTIDTYAHFLPTSENRTGLLMMNEILRADGGRDVSGTWHKKSKLEKGGNAG